jgi:hypothetical protein
MSEFFQVKTLQVKDNIIEKEISDFKHKMPFQITVGKNIKERKALFVLHGHGGNKKYARFYDDEWIIVCPLDIYGTEGFGSWWLGEEGNFFTFRLLQELISRVKEEYDLQQIYFWGSSMGGYGAILHGTICNADAVYAHMPQVKLIGTEYTDGSNSKYYLPIFGKESFLHKDLVEFLDNVEIKNSPIYFLSQNVFDYPNYVAQHFIPLIEVLDSKGFAYSVEMNLEQGHKVFRNIASTVDNIFKPNFDKIKEWRTGEKNLSKSIIRKINVDITYNEDVIEITSLHNIKNCDFACYLYINDELVSKQHYKNDPNFLFELNYKMQEGDLIVARYYARIKKSKTVRFSKSFSSIYK